MTITVLLAEDHTIVRKGLRSLLDPVVDIEVVGEAENGRDAVEQAEQSNPNIVVMDHAMPILNGLEATRQIKRRQPETKILILTMHTNEEYVFQFLKAGASGYLVKQSAPDELVAAIRAVADGQSFLSPSISKTLIEEFVRQTQEQGTSDSFALLTEREREVLQLVAEGHSNREIGDELHISLKTAAVHRTNIMNKLNLHSMADLTKYAIRKGIIDLE